MEITAFITGIVLGTMIGFVLTILYAIKEMRKNTKNWSIACDLWENTSNGWKKLYFDVKENHETLIRSQRSLLQQQERGEEGPRSIN